jgi:hypothetical protein
MPEGEKSAPSAGTLIETADGAEFGIAAGPEEVVAWLNMDRGGLVRLELALGEGPIWVNPAWISVVRPLAAEDIPDQESP